ncbi:MAG: hypothetical protein E7310_00145 [Clostridiales bacterium]|nr:hypothetical protein [Clostridiales bacterium]
MGKITKAEATKIAGELIEKYGIGETVKNYGNITTSLKKYTTKASLINEIYANGKDSIWFPWERNATFDNIEDNTILSVCKPNGTVTITEKFYGTYSVEELLNFDVTNLYNHYTGVSNEMTVSAGLENSNDYTIQYTGTSATGEEFAAIVTYNTSDFSKKNYEITKSWTEGNNRKTFKSIEKIYSTGEYWSSKDSVQTQKASYKNKIYTINQVESKITGINGDTKYLTTETVSDSNYRTLSNISFEYDNKNYSGNPIRVASEDTSTDSVYVEEYGKIKTAKGNMTLKCMYNQDGEIVIEKPALSNGIIETVPNTQGSNYIGTISVQNSTVKNLSQVVITPNETGIKNPQDFVKVAEKLKTIVSSQNNEIVVCKKGDTTASKSGFTYLTPEDYISGITSKE